MSSLVSRLEYRVPYADTDQMHVVYYANFFVYFERTRSEMLRDIGFTYREMEERGLMLPVVEAHCRYLQPARYDDLLILSGHFEILSPARLKAVCQVHRDGLLLAEGYSTHACILGATNRPVRLPPEIRNAVPQTLAVDAAAANPAANDNLSGS